MSARRPPPAAHVHPRGEFPDGPFRFGTPSEVYLAKGLATRLRDKIGDESVRYIARKTGVSAQTILNILHGKTWPDLYTIARLEVGLDTRLWGFEHRKRRPVNPRL